MLDVGDPTAARIAIMLETPANEEVNYSVLPPSAAYGTRQVLGTVKDAQLELARRTAAYPAIPSILRARGVPVVGRTGALLNRLLRAAGINRDEIFIMNSLRCFAPKSKKGDNYPTGAEKSIAQHACRQYDRLGVDGFVADIIVISIHPAALFKDGASSAEPLILADLEKVASFARDGHRVLLLMGGHAVDTFLGYFTNVSKSRGHYTWCGESWYASRIEKLRVRAERARRAARIKPPKAVKGYMIRCVNCHEVPKAKCTCEGGWEMVEKPVKVRKATKAEAARAELATRILDHLLVAGVFISPADWGQYHVAVITALTPLTCTISIQAIEPDAALPQ